MNEQGAAKRKAALERVYSELAKVEDAAEADGNEKEPCEFVVAMCLAAAVTYAKLAGMSLSGAQEAVRDMWKKQDAWAKEN